MKTSRMHLKLEYFLIIVGLAVFPKSYGQADMSMATHWYNRANYNPAFIARTDFIYLFSNIRYQWAGVNGAPRVINIQASEYIHSLRSAFGLSLVGDQLGASQALNPMLTYAYRIANNHDWSLSMGLAAGIFSRTVNGSLFEADVINDPSIHYSTEKSIQPDANAGFEFQNTSFIIGISSTHLFSIGKPDYLYLNTNHRYGYVIYKNNDLELFYYKLGLQIVNRDNFTVMEGNVSLRFKHPTGLIKGPKEIFDIGLTYRSTRQMTFMFGVLVSSNLRIGYAYDHSFIPGYSQNATHEIILEYRIPSKAASSRIKCGNELFWYH
jgi:type IX secretion system PorP/SprF family membrane protein